MRAMEPRPRCSPPLTAICLILVGVLIHGGHCFYLPGVAPEDFLKVISLFLFFFSFLIFPGSTRVLDLDFYFRSAFSLH
uniref:Uncharacterized protein MANES_16G129900 n=1 Tax=Rhizophora mucronata TaxID=61149 RepID=A0A2P2MD92_RHIMU